MTETATLTSARRRMPGGRLLAADLSIAGFAALLLSPGLAFGPSSDSAVFILVGDRIRAGEIPFKDVWDHKPPGAALLNAIVDAALPWVGAAALSWWISLAVIGVAMALLHHLLRRRVSGRAAYLWTLLGTVPATAYCYSMGGGYTESLALLPLAAALWLLDTGPDRPMTPVRSAWIGFWLAVACLLTIQAVPAAGALFAATVASSEIGVMVRRGVALLAGAVWLPAAIGLWLAGSGAIPAAYDQLVVYPVAYRQASHGFALAALMGVYGIGGLIAPALALMAAMVARARRGDRVMWTCAVWIVGSGLLIAYENRFYFHYLMVVIPPLTMLAAISFRRLLVWSRSETPARRLAGFGMAATTVVLISTGLLFTVEATTFMTLEMNTMQGYRTGAADWIQANTPASARVFIWGNNPEIHLITNRPVYGQYLYEFPIITPGYWTPARTEELLTAWSVDPPEIIVSGESDVPLYGAGMGTNDGRDYDTLDPLRAFVSAHYRLGTKSGVLGVYVLNGSSALSNSGPVSWP